MRLTLLSASLVLSGCGWFPAASPKAETVPKETPVAAPIAPVAESASPKPKSAKPSRPVATAEREAVVPQQSPPQEDVALKDRFITVSAKCQSAEETYNQLKADSTQSGRGLHPDISTSYFRMKTALDMAKRELDRHEDEEARHSLEVAELAATKVLRAGGGH
jgi:hypothetical protein